MDVILIAWMNNILKGYKPDDMLRDQLVRFVMHQALKYHPELHNTCTISNLYYSPQLCWFLAKGK